MRKLKKQKGFGLFDAFLLVTIIAGIVAALSNYFTYSNKAQLQAQDLSDLQTCKASIESQLDAASRNPRTLTVSKEFSWGTGLNNGVLKKCVEQTGTCVPNPTFSASPSANSSSYRLGYPFFLFDPLTFHSTAPIAKTDYDNNIRGLLAGWPANTSASPAWHGVRYKYNPRCEPCTQAEMAADTAFINCPLMAIALFNPTNCSTSTGPCNNFQVNTRVYKLPMNLSQINDETPSSLSNKTAPSPLERTTKLTDIRTYTGAGATSNKTPAFRVTVNSTTSFLTYEPRMCFYYRLLDVVSAGSTVYLACSPGVTSPVCNSPSPMTNCIGPSQVSNLRPFTIDSNGFRKNDDSAPDGNLNVTPPVTIDATHSTLGAGIRAARPCKLRFGYHVFVPLKLESTGVATGSGGASYASTWANRFYKCNANSSTSSFGTAVTALFDTNQWTGSNNYTGNRYVNRPCGLYDVSTDAPRTAYYIPRQSGGADTRSTAFITATSFTTGTTFRPVDITYLQNTRIEMLNTGSNSFTLSLIDGGFWASTYQASDMQTRMQVKVDLLPDSEGKYCEIVDYNI